VWPRFADPAREAGGEGTILASGVKEDARKLLAVLAGKEGAHKGWPVSAGPEDAAAAGFGVGASGERLHRAVWCLIAEGSLEPASGPDPPAAAEPVRGAVYRVTRTGLEEAREE
jgi:hypothetical protein